jgi:uncharacterized protein (TIRG00374 family)
MKRWRFWIGLLISVVFLWLALRGLSLAELVAELPGLNYWWLIPGIAVYFVAVWARSWRWHYLLRPIKAIPTGKLFPIVTIGYAGNNIFPARAGEVLRAVVLKRHEGVAISASLATIIVERVYDGVVMLAFISLTCPSWQPDKTDSASWGISVRWLCFGTVVFFGVPLVFLLLPWPQAGAGHFHLAPRLAQPLSPGAGGPGG